MSDTRRTLVVDVSRTILFVVAISACFAALADFPSDVSLAGAAAFVLAAQITLDAILVYVDARRGRALARAVAANVATWIILAGFFAAWPLLSSGLIGDASTLALVSVSMMLLIATALVAGTLMPRAQAAEIVAVLGAAVLPLSGLLPAADWLMWTAGAVGYVLWVVAVTPLVAHARSLRRLPGQDARTITSTALRGALLPGINVVVAVIVVWGVSWVLASVLVPPFYGELPIGVYALESMASDYAGGVTEAQVRSRSATAVNELARLAALSGTSLTLADEQSGGVLLAVRLVSRDASGTVVGEYADSEPPLPPEYTAFESVQLDQAETMRLLEESADYQIQPVRSVPVVLVTSDTPLSPPPLWGKAGYSLTEYTGASDGARMRLIASPSDDWWLRSDYSEPGPSGVALTAAIYSLPWSVLGLLAPYSISLWIRERRRLRAAVIDEPTDCEQAFPAGGAER